MSRSLRVPGLVLITGMSGTGKSTVVRALEARGVRAVDLDADAWSAWVPTDGDPTGANEGRDWVWREDRVGALLAEGVDEPLFVSGCAANMGAFLPRFDRVVLLSAPAAVLLGRLATRVEGAYGGRAEEVAAVLRNLREVEPRLRRIATHEIDTRAPVEAVVAAILEAAANASAGTLRALDQGPPQCRS